jgi:glycogen debranching enzyme
MRDRTAQVLTGLYEASLEFDLQRLPELFCGFQRTNHAGPTQYPVACAPQAWSAGAVFLLLQACLGLSVNGLDHAVTFRHPVLPECIPQLMIRNLRVGECVVDLQLERHERDVGVRAVRREGDLDVILLK